MDLDDTVIWRRSEIVDVVAGGEDDDDGVVEFRAPSGAPDSMTYCTNAAGSPGLTDGGVPRRLLAAKPRHGERRPVNRWH